MRKDTDTVNAYLDQLKTIFSAMDGAYEKAARGYGFICRGCEDNCCMTRFYHHTILEYTYLTAGLETLEPSVQSAVQDSALDVVQRMRDAEQKGGPVRIMCPLNADGFCLLYEYRPMICRLHGIPHELRRSGRAPDRGPGCQAFVDQCGKMDYITFDRTPFYMELARLEKAFRAHLGETRKFKKTIAEMIMEKK